MSLPYNKNNIKTARGLRKNATPEENHLWYDFLRKYRPKFQRQKSIDHYIVDFYCHKAKLVIELDGSQHFTEDGKDNDKSRTQALEAYGLKVIRFTNWSITSNFIEVCNFIDTTVKNESAHNVSQR